MFEQYTILAQKININNKKVYTFYNKEKETRNNKKTKSNTITITIILILLIPANNPKFKSIFPK